MGLPLHQAEYQMSEVSLRAGMPTFILKDAQQLSANAMKPAGVPNADIKWSMGHYDGLSVLRLNYLSKTSHLDTIKILLGAYKPSPIVHQEAAGVPQFEPHLLTEIAEAICTDKEVVENDRIRAKLAKAL